MQLLVHRGAQWTDPVGEGRQEWFNTNSRSITRISHFHSHYRLCVHVHNHARSHMQIRAKQAMLLIISKDWKKPLKDVFAGLPLF